jgi:hypothetical protein
MIDPNADITPYRDLARAVIKSAILDAARGRPRCGPRIRDAAFTFVLDDESESTLRWFALAEIDVRRFRRGRSTHALRLLRLHHIGALPRRLVPRNTYQEATCQSPRSASGSI